MPVKNRSFARLIIPLRWANVILVLITLSAYLSPVVSPADFWPFSLLGLFYPWMLLANLLFIIFWVSQKQWQPALISLGCVLVGWEHMRSIIGLGSQGATSPETSVIHIATFNCHGLRDWHEKIEGEGEDLPPDVLSFLLQEPQPDIICIQEFPLPKSISSRYIRYFQEEAGLTHSYQDRGGLIILSRFPFAKTSTYYFENRANGYQIVDLNIDGRIVRLFHVHLQSNAVTTLAEAVAEHGEIQNRRTWRNLKGMMGRYRRNARIRAQQAESIARLIAGSPTPVIVSGDLNDVPQSYAYRQLSAGLQDTFKKRGGGLGMTYAGNIPGLRIDYIMADPSFRVLRHQTGKKNFSDHRPVLATLQMLP